MMRGRRSGEVGQKRRVHHEYGRATHGHDLPYRLRERTIDLRRIGSFAAFLDTLHDGARVAISNASAGSGLRSVRHARTAASLHGWQPKSRSSTRAELDKAEISFPITFGLTVFSLNSIHVASAGRRRRPSFRARTRASAAVRLRLDHVGDRGHGRRQPAPREQRIPGPRVEQKAGGTHLRYGEWGLDTATRRSMFAGLRCPGPRCRPAPVNRSFTRR